MAILYLRLAIPSRECQLNFHYVGYHYPTMEKLLMCEACGHGAIVHDPSGCGAVACRCRKPMTALVDDALEAARGDIRRDWHVAS